MRSLIIALARFRFNCISNNYVLRANLHFTDCVTHSLRSNNCELWETSQLAIIRISQLKSGLRYITHHPSPSLPPSLPPSLTPSSPQSDLIAGVEVGPNLGMVKSSSLESLHNIVAHTIKRDISSAAGAGRSSRESANSFRTTVDRSRDDGKDAQRGVDGKGEECEEEEEEEEEEQGGRREGEWGGGARRERRGGRRRGKERQYQF